MDINTILKSILYGKNLEAPFERIFQHSIQTFNQDYNSENYRKVQIKKNARKFFLNNAKIRLEDIEKEKTKIQTHDIKAIWINKLNKMHGKDKKYLFCYFIKYFNSLQAKTCIVEYKKYFSESISQSTFYRYLNRVKDSKLYNRYGLPQLYKN